jgi:hypothetical protein
LGKRAKKKEKRECMFNDELTSDVAMAKHPMHPAVARI